MVECGKRIELPLTLPEWNLAVVGPSEESEETPSAPLLLWWQLNLWAAHRSVLGPPLETRGISERILCASVPVLG
jgi:hypothetical protein